MTIKIPFSVKPASDGDRKADAFIAGAVKPVTAAGKTVVNMRFDAGMLSRIDAAARRQGISRTAWLHVAASKALDQ